MNDSPSNPPPKNITFQVSGELWAWLNHQAGLREQPMGSYVRGLCVDARQASATPLPPPARTDHVLTLPEIRRAAGRAKGKAAK